MDSPSIIAPANPDLAELTQPNDEIAVSSASHCPSFSIQANHDSITDAADRDLQASLQLLADRMQYITGASAATIALDKGHGLLCCASAGPMATDFGAPIRADFTLVNQSISTQQIICCNNTRDAVGNDGTRYQDLGIRAIMVMPLIRESEVVGVLELLAGKTNAFDDHDGAALERLSEIVLTALGHAEAAKRALTQIAAGISAEELEVPAPISAARVKEGGARSPESGADKRIPRIHHCGGCGFPVSEGRVLCLDCEEARTEEDGNGTVPTFLSELGREHGQGWLQSHFYTIGTLLMVLLTVIVLMLRLR
jgi:GAF domain